MWMLVMSLIIGDPETAPVQYILIAENMSLEECMADLEDARPIWYGTDYVGMFCEMQ